VATRPDWFSDIPSDRHVFNTTPALCPIQVVVRYLTVCSSHSCIVTLRLKEHHFFLIFVALLSCFLCPSSVTKFQEKAPIWGVTWEQ